MDQEEQLGFAAPIPLVGSSVRMHTVFESILKVSKSSEPVLISGETGTGKELVAKVIHHMGIRRNKPFTPVDCCTLVPSLIETELFGHVRGAFTGAEYTTHGLFEAAHGGTIFLDEISELQPGLQAKLLRIIQERQFRRVGGTGWLTFDGRIIAATNRELEREVQNGSFRADLFFRLNVLRIHLPPLRHRKEDIPALAEHFLALATEPGQEAPALSNSATELLKRYDWPGNVRELENCIRRAVVWRSGPVIYPEDLPLHVREPGSLSQPSGSNSNQSVLPLRDLERDNILKAMAVTHGDKVAAARLLQIGKTTLYRKLKEYGIGEFTREHRIREP